MLLFPPARGAQLSVLLAVNGNARNGVGGGGSGGGFNTGTFQNGGSGSISIFIWTGYNCNRWHKRRREWHNGASCSDSLAFPIRMVPVAAAALVMAQALVAMARQAHSQAVAVVVVALAPLAAERAALAALARSSLSGNKGKIHE